MQALLVLAEAHRCSAGHAGQTRPTRARSQGEGERAGEKEREKERKRERDTERKRERRVAVLERDLSDGLPDDAAEPTPIFVCGAARTHAVHLPSRRGGG